MVQSGYSDLYSNPIVKTGTYLAKVDRVKASARPDGATTLTVELVLDHYGPEVNGKKLIAIVHSTEKGRKFFDAFLNAYRVTEQTVQQAVGRYAAVWIYDTQYQGSFYSAVKFPLQTFAVQEKVTEIEAEEAALRKTRQATRPRPTPAAISPTGYIDWTTA